MRLRARQEDTVQAALARPASRMILVALPWSSHLTVSRNSHLLRDCCIFAPLARNQSQAHSGIRLQRDNENLLIVMTWIFRANLEVPWEDAPIGRDRPVTAGSSHDLVLIIVDSPSKDRLAASSANSQVQL